MATNATATATATLASEVATKIGAALKRASDAGEASLARAYGKDTRADAPRSLATAVKYARDAARVLAGEVELPKRGERRTFVQRIISASEASDALTETLLVELARDVLAADRKRRREAREAASEAKRADAADYNAAISSGDADAAAALATRFANESALARIDKVADAASRFASAASAAKKSGVSAALAYEVLARTYGFENPATLAGEASEALSVVADEAMRRLTE